VTNNLTAAEALILMDPRRKNGRDAFKSFLVELMARGAITVRKPSGRKDRGALTFAPDIEEKLPDSAYVRPVLEILASRPDFAGKEVSLLDATTTAGETLKAGFEGFRTRYVLPSLQERGLVTSEEKIRLKFIHQTIWSHTPAGAERAAALKRQVETGAEIRKLLKKEPAQAAALVASLGTAVFLVPQLRGHFNEVGAVMRDPRANPGMDSSFYVSSETSEDGETSGFRFGDSVDFDSFDDSFGAIDSGVDSGDSSGDGGGDGGGD